MDRMRGSMNNTRAGIDRVGSGGRQQYGRHDMVDGRGRGYHGSPGRYPREYDGGNYGGSGRYDGYNRGYQGSPGRYPREYHGSPGRYPREYDGGNYGSARYDGYNRDYRDGYYDNPPDRRYPLPRERAVPYDRNRGGNRNGDYGGRYDRYPPRPAGQYRGVSGGSGPLRRPLGTNYSGTPGNNFTKIFIGNMSGKATEEELTNAFSMYGPINKVDFRRKFAFVDYARSRDAEAAIKDMNGKLCWGSRIKVQPHIEQQRKLPLSREPKLSCQVTVTNLDQSISWQDLKDFARQAGDVNYASIIIRGTKRFGLVEFTNEETVKIAHKELSGKKIANNKLDIIECPVSEYLKQFETNGDTNDQFVNIINTRLSYPHRCELDTFEAEDTNDENDKEPKVYQESNLDSVDYD